MQNNLATVTDMPMVQAAKRARKSVPPTETVKPVVKRPRSVPSELSFPDKVRAAFSRKNALGSVLGALAGGLVPVASYYVAHTEMDLHNDPFSVFTAIVIGCLVYSASSVFQFGVQAFHSRWKAFGFVVLTEGILVFSAQTWLALTCLAYLVVINAVNSAVNISRKKALPRDV